MIAAFFGLTQTSTGLRVEFQPWNFNLSSAGEVNFWLAHALLLLPASLLIGYALSPIIGAALTTGQNRLASLERKGKGSQLAGLGVLALLIARGGRWLWLLDQPFTDDEEGVRFGGQVMAMGELKVPALPFWESMPKGYLFTDAEGMTTSMDWFGVQATWALAEVTGLGAWVFAFAAAIPTVALAWALGRRLGPEYGVMGAAIMLFSPMASALSMTSHAHLSSRACLALALAVYLVVTEPREDEEASSPRLWALFGLLVGASFLCRPFETTTLAAPLFAERLFAGWKTKPARGQFLAALGGLSVGVALFMLYNALITGNPLLPARFSLSSVAQHSNDDLTSKGLGLLWHRFGANLGYNLLMLCVWFLGPLGVLLAIVGALRNRVTAMLALGVFCNLLLALLHNNYGLHSVGPIHYSESVVPLTVIAAFGAAAIVAWSREHRLDVRLSACLFAAALVIGLGLFNTWHANALRKQARIHQTIYAAIDRADLASGVVLVPSYQEVWSSFERFKEVGSWVLSWRRPRPDGADHMLIMSELRDLEKMNSLRRAFPRRVIYQLQRVETEPGLELRVLYPALEP